MHDHLAVGVAAGSALVQAAVEGVSNQLGISVQPPIAATLTVAPADTGVAQGQSVQLLVTARDHHGANLPAHVVWSSSDSTIATVSAAGRVTTAAAGTVTIRAAMDSLNATSTIVVTPAAATPSPAPPSGGPTKLSVNGPTPIIVGLTFDIVATIFDSQNHIVHQPVTWSLSDSSLAGIFSASDSDILLLSRKTGTLVVRATTAPNLVGSFAISISNTAPGIPMSIVFATPVAKGVARNIDVSGSDRSAPTTWASSDSTIAVVQGSQLIALSAGTVQISATNSGVTVFKTVTVTPGPTAFINWVSFPGNLFVGDNGFAQIQTLDATGHVITGRPVVWTSRDPSLATIDASGLIRALGPGQPVLTATVDEMPQDQFINVAVRPPATATMSPINPPPLHVGQTIQFVASAFDAAHNPISVPPEWAIVAPVGTASITAAGLFTALAPGDAVVLLDYANTFSSYASVTVHVIP